MPSSSASSRRSYRQSCSNNGGDSGPCFQLHELVKSLPTCGCGLKSPVKYSTSQRNPGRAYFNCNHFPNGCKFFWWIERELLNGDSQRDALVDELAELRKYISTVWVKNLSFFGYGFISGILFVLTMLVLLRM
jgi:hypothetical protein